MVKNNIEEPKKNLNKTRNEEIKNVKKKVTKKDTKSSKKNVKEKIVNSDNYFSTLEVVILLFTSVIVSLVIGSVVTYNINKDKNTYSDKYIKEFMKNYKYINDNYYKKVDKEKLIKGAIEGMIGTLDDGYSYVIGEEETDNFNIRLDGEYKGIGVEIVNLEDGKVAVYSVFEDSPADKAGLKAGDIIKKVDEIDCNNASTTDVSKYIRGTAKDKFKITIVRDGEEKELTINKENVVIKAVKSKTFKKNGKKIGYISMSIFSNNAINQFENELSSLEKDNIDSLIIDVRGNSGGHLTTATRIISLFLDSNHIMYQTNTRGKIEKFYSNGTKTKKYPIVVLQNHESASASEILSAALQEEYNAIVVGEDSFGKGTVQELTTLDNNTEFKITTKLWLTPKGKSINGKGVKPDVNISLNEEYIKNPIEEKDNQLQEAIDILSKK